MTAPDAVEFTTELALHAKAALRRCMGRADLVFFTLCAIVTLDTLGQVASFGAATFTWIVLLAVLFLVPYALVMAELGSTFTQEGGLYEWIKLSFNRFWAGIGAVAYWITTPIWVGGSLAFVATAAWGAHIHAIGDHWSPGNVIFKLAFIWTTILFAIIALRWGRWISAVGAIVRIVLLGVFSVTVVIYGLEHGLHGYSASAFSPFHIPVLLGLVPLLLFNYVGFELQNGAAEEMNNPEGDVPYSVLRACLITAISYAIPVFGIVAVLPAHQVAGISGFLAAIGQTFTVYGAAGHFLTQVMAAGFIVALVTTGTVWIMGSDRILAVAAADGAFPAYFGHFHRRLGTPVRVNIMSGVIATAFCGAATQLLAGNQANTFLVVLLLATSATLLGYLLVFPAAPVLRRRFTSVHRPYHVPGGELGLWVCSILCSFWVALGSWVAVFPGTLNHLFGERYSIHAAFGVSAGRFEAFTLGTLAVIILVGIAGYALGTPVRRSKAIAIPIQAATGSDGSPAGAGVTS